MKKVLFLLLASFLVLAACGNKEEGKSEDKKETKSSSKDSKKDDKKKDDDKKSDEEKDKTDDQSKEEVATQDETIEQPVQSQEQQNVEEQPSQEQIQQSTDNITDESQLQNILSGNYSEEQKIQAYNSAVANGVIPQGTVSEGSAQAAYESSKGIQNGETQKDQLAERYQSWVDAGIMTEEEMQEELAK